MSAPRVLALIPAYNEGDRVARVVQGARAQLPVLVVDDGSTDGTGRFAADAGAEVLRQQPTQGKGAALRRGFTTALERGYDAVLTLDADGQHDVAEIPRFLERFAANRADLIIGSRSFSGMPPVRRFANTVGTWCFSWALGQQVADHQSGYRLISRRLLEKLLDSQESGFEFEVEMIVTCVQNGFGLDSVPIRTIYGDEKSHIRRGHHVKHFFRVVWQTRQRMRARS